VPPIPLAAERRRAGRRATGRGSRKWPVMDFAPWGEINDDEPQNG